MIIRRTVEAVACALVLAGPVAAAMPVCPVEPACIDLMPGEVSIQPMYAGQTLCVAAQDVASAYTLVPINPSLTDAMPAGITAASVIAANVVSVTEPKAPGPMLLAPLHEVSETPTAEQVALAAELMPLLAPERRNEVLLDNRPNRGVGVPVLGALMQIQVAPGCMGTPDWRTGRVEAISDGAGSKLYMVQEVVEASPGEWQPAIPGGFTDEHFAALANAYVSPPPGFESGGLNSVLRTGARDLLQANFGTQLDLDANNGVVVFFTTRINQTAPPASPQLVVARFEARDLLSASPGACPLSNEGEFIYALLPDPTGLINGNVRTVSSVFGGSTRAIVHQMVRLTNAQRRLYVTFAPDLEEPWLDESLAWVAEELIFYNTSVGLQPKSNITLADLTSGPNASARVSAFNTFQNPQFGALRQHMLASAGQGSFGALQTDPPPDNDELPNEQISRYYGATAAFLRYAMDRHPASDADLLQALVDSQLTGQQNLDAVFGTDLRRWVHDFGVAISADDTALVVDDVYRTQSWNFRSVYSGLGGFPLATVPIAEGITQSFTLGPGGGQRWYSFGVPADAPPAQLQLNVGATAPMTPLRVAIIRTQ